MKLSIITINYNNSKGLAETILSVRNQTFTDYEYIIIDGGSQDDSIDIIKQNSDKITYWVSEPDKGIYDAMNKGILAARGNYVQFLNSGDCLVSDEILQLCYDIILDAPDNDIFYGNIIRKISSEQAVVYTHPNNLSLDFFLHFNLNHQASFIRSNLFQEFGLYPSEYKLAGDHWLFLKSFIASKAFIHIDFPLIAYDFGGQSESNRDEYGAEMSLIWEKEVPKFAREVVERLLVFKLMNESRLVKSALFLSKLIRKIKIDK